MPTAREFEDAAIEYCIDSSGVGVWALHLKQVDQMVYDITVRRGGRYRADTAGMATIRVTYSPYEQRFSCRPTEPTLPDLALVDNPAYLFE